jgi:hypothetical protein
MSSDIQSFIGNIVAYATDPELQQILLPAKLTFVVIAFVMLALLIFTVLKTHYFEWLYLRFLFEFLTYRGYGTSKITKLWNKTMKRLDSPLESEHKLAVIEADDILDNSLKKIGYPGQTLEEKLEKLTIDTISNIDELKTAHRVRNNIVHDPDYRPGPDEIRKVMDIYAATFHDLQILD